MTTIDCDVTGIDDGILHDVDRQRIMTPALPSSQTRIRCREITANDLDGIINLLTVGFEKDRARGYWTNAIKRLSEHPTPQAYPKYGYLLESGGILVGVLLLIFSSRVNPHDLSAVRCNGSSLYVQPEFRSYAALLIKHALRFKEVTYLNITPARHTWPMLSAQGYKRFSDGLFLAIPILSRSPKVRIRLVTAETYGGLKPFEIEILLAHASYGCLSVVCDHEDQQFPFVFGLRKKYHVPLAHLTYCRDQQDFVRFAGALGQLLAKHGYPVVVLDANGSIEGLVGKYLAGMKPKYSRGPETMRLGDLPYTERVMFGF